MKSVSALLLKKTGRFVLVDMDSFILWQDMFSHNVLVYVYHFIQIRI